MILFKTNLFTVIPILLLLLTQYVNGQCTAEISAYGDDLLFFYESSDNGNAFSYKGLSFNWYDVYNEEDIQVDENTVFKFMTRNGALCFFNCDTDTTPKPTNPGGFIATIKVCGPTNECHEFYTDKKGTFEIDEDDVNFMEQEGYEFTYYRWDSSPWTSGQIYNNDKTNGKSPNINDDAIWIHWLQLEQYISITFSFSRFKAILNNICSNEWNDDKNLFVVPNQPGKNFTEAQNYCKTEYNGNIANIYDPEENRRVLQLVNLNFLEKAFIGYYKIGSTWKWESQWNERINITSNPMLWIDSPLADISSNIEQTDTLCIFMTRYGWQYARCDNDEYFFVCTCFHSFCYQYNPRGYQFKYALLI